MNNVWNRCLQTSGKNSTPEKLMVYATYTRRGGLDINPCRVSDLTWMPRPIRLARQ